MDCRVQSAYGTDYPFRSILKLSRIQTGRSFLAKHVSRKAFAKRTVHYVD